MTTQHVDEELTLATQAFLEGEECTVDVAKREVSSSLVVPIILSTFTIYSCVLGHA